MVTVAFAAESAPKTVTVVPSEATLRGSRGRRQLLVTAEYQNGIATDLTRDAKYTSKDIAICEVNSSGIILPRGDGETTIQITTAAGSASVAVTVTGMSEPPQIEFRTDVIAALSRVGCSQGACHGSPQGKGGFRLSLRGFDPTLDFLTLAREDNGRRINSLKPDDSLILLKASGRIPHQGGVRFHPADDSYQTLHAWIAGGCVDSAKPRRLVSLETIPAKRAMKAGNPKQQIVALAHFEDGSAVDVTNLAVFTTGHDSAYTVSAW